MRNTLRGYLYHDCSVHCGRVRTGSVLTIRLNNLIIVIYNLKTNGFCTFVYLKFFFFATIEYVTVDNVQFKRFRTAQ